VSQPPVGSFSTGMLDARTRARLSGMVTGTAPSAQTLLLTIVPTLWAGMLRGQLANICVDSCRILQCCYAQFGIRSEIRAVDLAVTDDAGRMHMHGTPQPSWEGNVLDGHCILYLPDEQRIVDATIEQFREIARLKHGPLVGRMAVQLTPGLHGSGGRLPAGAQLPVRRGNLSLLYTIADDDATRVILDHPAAREDHGGHQRAGVNLASATLEFLRRHSQARPLDLSPYPRVAALLAAVGQASGETDQSGDWYFSVPGDGGEASRRRLDQIPLPPGTPPPAQDSAPTTPSGEPDPEPPQRPAGRLRGTFRRRRTPVRTAPARTVSAGPELDAAALVQGLPIPGGVLLRMARPGDSAEVSRLLAMAGVDLPPYLADAIDNQDIGSTLMHALEGGNDQILTALATAAHRGDPNLAMPGLTALLVAEDARHHACGALLALPPAAVMAKAAGAGIPVQLALVGTAAIVKINGIAVDESSRGNGIGTALLGTCLQMYFQLNYLMAYGQFRADSGLETYYRRLGFDVLAPGEGISLSERLAMPIGLTPESGERFFLRWR
jgi:GNAT superfamily N-acetyltransferase